MGCIRAQQLANTFKGCPLMLWQWLESHFSRRAQVEKIVKHRQQFLRRLIRLRAHRLGLGLTMHGDLGDSDRGDSYLFAWCPLLAVHSLLSITTNIIRLAMFSSISIKHALFTRPDLRNRVKSPPSHCVRTGRTIHGQGVGVLSSRNQL